MGFRLPTHSGTAQTLFRFSFDLNPPGTEAGMGWNGYGWRGNFDNAMCALVADYKWVNSWGWSARGYGWLLLDRML